MAKLLFPYISSGGPVVQMIEQLRRSFPASIDAATLRKLGIASNNESYMISILKFLGLINADGQKNAELAKIFYLDDDAFKEGFAAIVQAAYAELFDLRGDEAWTLDSKALTSFFRHANESTEIVGKRQTSTFKTLAALAGHASLPPPKTSAPAQPKKTVKKAAPAKTKADAAAGDAGTPPPLVKDAGVTPNGGGIGLTVRIEVNLPASADQLTYDRIFQSIRKNLIDGNNA